MAGPTGLEPATSSVTGKRSNQLSYGPISGTNRKTNYKTNSNLLKGISCLLLKVAPFKVRPSGFIVALFDIGRSVRNLDFYSIHECR